MKIALGSDHGGYPMKEHVKAWLESHGYEVEDKGCFGLESVDYPIYAKAAAEAVASGECDRGSAPPASASPSRPTRLRASAAPCAATPTPPR